MKNLFELANIPQQEDPELFQTLVTGQQGLLVERIVSTGQTTPEGEWYDQERDEWVVILEGSAVLGFADGSEARLQRGDHLLLPRHMRHRVLETSNPCIWLAIHANTLEKAHIKP